MSTPMQQTDVAKKEPDTGTSLAIERTQLALERTHLAWIRTMFTIITAGIAIDKGFAYIHQQRMQQNIAFTKNAHLTGVFLTSFGTILLLIETIQFVRRSRQLAEMKMGKVSFFSTGSVLSFLILLLGIVLIYLMLTTD